MKHFHTTPGYKKFVHCSKGTWQTEESKSGKFNANDRSLEIQGEKKSKMGERNALWEIMHQVQKITCYK